MILKGSGCELMIPDGELLPLKDIERSIIKKYRKYLWSPFMKAVRDYKLIDEGDRIAVAISGGKDSLVMAMLFKELHKHSAIPFELKFIAMNPGFYEQNKIQLLKNCEHLEIPVEMFETDIFEVAGKIAGDAPCYMCAKMRRGALYGYAEKLDCNKLALGHHYDDVIETTMLNLLYAGSIKTMMPKLKSQNHKKMQIIRPLFYVREEAIKKYTRASGILAMNCGCAVASGKIATTRYEIKDLIESLKEKNPNVEKSIFKAMENINLDACIGWQKDGIKHSFLDEY